ncbi:MAG: DMT family transporter [Firmicutes bacterium]|nr:DMT family transporter [Bacillota bacterium]
MSSKKIARLLPIFSGALWGLTGIFVRNLNSIGFDNPQITFFRCSLTALALVIFLSVSDKRQLKIHPKDLWCFFGTGIVSVFSFSLFYFYTLMHSSISVAVILTYTAPFFAMLFSAVLFGEKFTPAKVAALIMATAGCFLLCKTDKNTVLTPIVIATGLLAGLTYALYSIFARFVVKKYPPLVITAYTFIFASAASAFCLDFKEVGSLISSSPSSVFILIAFAVVSALLPYVLLTIGLKYVKPGKAAILTTTEVLTASLCGVFFFHEKITAAGILGIILILTAVILINIKLTVKKL